MKNAFELINNHPEIGRNYLQVDIVFFGFKVNRHIIFYRKHMSKGIEIVRVLYEMMDIPTKMEQ